MMTLTRHLAGLLLLSLLTPVTRAQDALGDGRALDNNLRAGSGGINSPAPQSPYGAGEAIVTGNVPGLGFFRDRVDYRAPGEFRGRLGSDDIFRFNARSYSATVVPGSPVATQSGVGTITVYRTQTGATVGDVQRRGDQIYILLPQRDAAPRPLDPLLGPGAGSSTLLRPHSGDQTLALIQEEGKLLEVRASPLLGLRTSALVEETVVGQPERADDPRLDRRLPPGVLRAPDLDAAPAEQEPGAGLSVQLGAALQTSLRAEQPHLMDRQRQRLAELHEALFRPLQTTPAEPGQDAYIDLLTRLRQHEQQDTPQPAAERLPGVPGVPGVPGADPREGAALPHLDPPTPAALREAQTQREEAVRQAERAADGLGADPGQLSPEVQQWLTTIDHDLPPLATLAGSGRGALNLRLREAEEALQQRRYFDADAAYRSVLLVQPGHPLATIGRVHAQMGAGVLRTASQGLRQVLERHPEMIAVRYQPLLLPAAERLTALRHELESLTVESGTSEPALLLAYLGYQLGAPDVVRYGLDLAQARQPRDALIPLLRRVWVDEQ